MAPAEMMADATTLEAFLKTISDDASAVDFEDTMAAIEDGYDYAAVAFKCGAVASAADQNQGSAKIFSFAKLQELDEATTLQLFGRFYRKDVLENPDGDDHGNIRNYQVRLGRRRLPRGSRSRPSSFNRRSDRAERTRRDGSSPCVRSCAWRRDASVPRCTFDLRACTREDPAFSAAALRVHVQA